MGYGIAAAVLELFAAPILKGNLVPAYGAIIGLCIGGAQALASGGGRLSTHGENQS